jgi:hypothetical protein
MAQNLGIAGAPNGDLKRVAATPDLNRIFAYIAVLEAVINDARKAGDEESAETAMRLLGGLWQRIVETPKLLRQLTEPLSEAEWLRRYARKRRRKRPKQKRSRWSGRRPITNRGMRDTPGP